MCQLVSFRNIQVLLWKYFRISLNTLDISSWTSKKAESEVQTVYQKMIFVSSDLHIFFFRHDVRHWNWSQGLPQRDATLTIIHPRDANEWKMTVHLGENKLLQSVCIATNNLSNPEYFSVYKLFWIGKVWVLSQQRLKKEEIFALLPYYQTKKVEKCQPDAVAAFSSWHWHRCCTMTCDPDSANQVFRNCKSSSQISPQQSHLPFHHWLLLSLLLLSYTQTFPQEVTACLATSLGQLSPDLGDLAWPITLFYAAPAWLSGSVRREISATSLSSNIFWSKYFSSRREIPAGNYQMHVVHCARNIALCKHCDEPVPRGELEDHIREFHSKVDCVCGEKIDKPKLEYHKVMKEIVLEIQIILSAGERVFQENNSLQVLCDSCWDGEPWRTWELLWQQDWEVWEGDHDQW